MRVFRYTLGITDDQVVEMPLSSRPLSVAPGRTPPGMPPKAEWIDLWAQVPEEAPPVPYHFYVVGTGNPMSAAASIASLHMFVGTAVMPSGMVWHVFWDPRA